MAIKQTEKLKIGRPDGQPGSEKNERVGARGSGSAASRGAKCICSSKKRRNKKHGRKGIITGQGLRGGGGHENLRNSLGS